MIYKISQDLYKLKCYFCNKDFKFIENNKICICTPLTLPKYSYFCGGLMHICYSNSEVLFTTKDENITLFTVLPNNFTTQIKYKLKMNIYNFNYDKFIKYLLLQ